jgi:hypothetical protein
MKGNGDLQVRDHVMRKARRRIRSLAIQGLTVGEIIRSFDELNETERQVVSRLARDEVEAARKQRAAESLRRGESTNRPGSPR